MRLLSSTLLAAQKQPSAVPYLRLRVAPKAAGVARLTWSRLYTGAEADSYHAAAMPSDGSLLRARIDPATDTLYLQRVASPGPGSDFGAWSSLGSAAEAGIALCSRGASVLLCSVAADGVTIQVRESADSGASFGSPVTAAVAPVAVGWLAVDYGQTTGVIALFYSASDGAVRVVKRSSGVWGSPAAWSNSLASVSGLACVYSGDWDLIVAGVTPSGDSGVWSCIYGDDFEQLGGVWSCIYGDDFGQLGGAWSPLREVILANPGSGVSFRAPFLQQPDVFRLFYVEQYNGAVSYSKPSWTAAPIGGSFASNLWREPSLFDLASSYGLALASGGAYAWLSTPSGVWRASLDATPLDLTADVESLRLAIAPGGSRVRAVLRNDDGRYGSPGAGALAALTTGAELAIDPGYVTLAGNEVSSGLGFWIEGWEHLSEGGLARFAVEAVDGWGLLERWRSRRQFAWLAGQKNVFNLLAFSLARAGFALASHSSSAAVSDYYPAFAIHPGDSAATAVRRLLALVPDQIYFRGATACLRNPQSAEAADYAYGTGHAILRAAYGSRAFQANRAQVYGTGVMAEALDAAEQSLVGERLRQVHDLNLVSSGAAQDRAAAVLREEALAAFSGEMEAPVNCGQELYDVVAVTDARAGLTAAKRRVLGLTLHYDRAARPRYVTALKLGGV